MMRIAAIACTVFLFGITSLCSAIGKDAPNSESQLLDEFKTALHARDRGAILALFNGQGVSPEMTSFEYHVVVEMLKQEIKGAHLSSFPTNYPLPFNAGGVRYALNIPATGLIVVDYEQSGLPFPPFAYGKSGGGYYIAGITEKETAVSGAEINHSLTIEVQNADGKPLPNTAVVCASSETVPEIDFNTLFGGNRKFWTDEKGQFKLPLTGTNLFLVAANDAGFGSIQNRDLTNHAVMVMRPWGRIKGTRTNRNHVVTDEHLSLSPDRSFYRFDEVAPVRSFHKETRTDAQGRFVFENIPPLKYFIDRQEKQGDSWKYFWPVDATPGGTNRMAIMTRGRTVTGRVTVAPGLETNIDLAACSGTLVSRMKDREGLRRSVGFPVSTDGSFRADRVESGDYTISGEIRRDNRLVALLDSISVQIPDDTSDAEDVPFDMGTVELKAAVNFMKGDAAPDFSCATLDDKPLNLSTFRGKYVLLDFWATWCGPCIAEIPNLKATYDAYGKDDSFVMISLSLDSELAAPKKFARDQGIAWTQGFLGDWSKDKTTQIYGVYSIPAVFLIGPDGKVLATDLRGSKIKEAVAAALAH